MNIAIYTEALWVLTSGYPERGMLLQLLKKRKDDNFVIFIRNKPIHPLLKSYYEELLNNRNVNIRYIDGHPKIVILKQLLGFNHFIDLNGYDLFLNFPGSFYLNMNKGLQICQVADLSAIRSKNTATYDNLIFNYFLYYISKYRLNKVLRMVDHIYTISNYVKEDLLDYYPFLSKEKVSVIYNGIANFWFSDQYVDLEGIGGRPNYPYFIWYGVVSRRKNIERLLKVFTSILDEREDFPGLLIVGKVPDSEKYVYKYLNNKITYLPFQEEMVLKTLVKHSRGLIFPSLSEGFGLPVIEAFSQGISVAYANITSLPEVAGGYGFAFDPYSDESMRKAIILLYEHKLTNDECLMLRQHAERFSYDQAAADFSNLIDRLLFV